MGRWGIMVNKVKGLLVLILLFLLITSHRRINGFNNICQDLSNSGANINKVVVEGHGDFYSREKLINILYQIYKTSGIKENLQLTKNKETVSLISNSNSHSHSHNIEISVKSLCKENLYYASFSQSQYMEVKNINNIIDSIEKCFFAYKVKPKISYLCEGEYDARMNTIEMKGKVENLFKSFKSEYIDGIEDRNLVSYIGYTPTIGVNITTLEKKTNLNIAMRCDKQKGKTYIWMGCPVIYIEY